MFPSPSPSSTSSPKVKEECSPLDLHASKQYLIHQQVLDNENDHSSPRNLFKPHDEDEFDISEHLNMDMFANSPPASPHDSSSLDENENDHPHHHHHSRHRAHSPKLKLESPPTSNSASDAEDYLIKREHLTHLSGVGGGYDSVAPNISEFPPASEVSQVPEDFDASLFDSSATAANKFQLYVDELPAKSRVETQIKLGLSIYPPPQEKMLHLPADTISKPKLQLKVPFEPSPDTLMLETVVVCDSKRSRQATMCLGCIKRERKRAFRKKVCLPVEEQHWSDDKEKRVIVFNCRELMQIGQPAEIKIGNSESKVRTTRLELPMRFACYCRHHNEKVGFRSFFTLKDWQGNVLARAKTTPVMITDDHKAQSSTTTATNSAVPSTVTTPISNRTTDFRFPTNTSSSAAAIPDRQSSSSSLSSLYDSHYQTANSRKRKKSDPRGMPPMKNRSSTDMPSMNGMSRNHSSRNSATSISSVGILSPPALSASGTSTAATSPQSMENSAPGIDDSALSFQPKSGDSLSLFSPPSVKSEFITGAAAGGVATSTPAAATAAQADVGPLPTIKRVIPGTGPVRGGMEVTVLGTGFVPGLVTRFGDSRSPITHCWNASTVVTQLPPASAPGPVVVTFEGWAMSDSQIFTYYDDTDQQLIELALQVVGLKMNGRLEDARDIARNIIGNTTGLDPQQLQQRLSSVQRGGSVEYDSLAELESLVLNCVEYAESLDTEFPVALASTNSQGQSLLHLAALLGLDELCAGLLDRKVALDAVDVNGFTPMHFAALASHEDIIELLVEDPSDFLRRTASGKSVLDLANEEVREMLVSSYMIRSRRASNASLSLRPAMASSSQVSESHASPEASPTRASRRGGAGNRQSPLRGISEYFSDLRENVSELIKLDRFGQAAPTQPNFWNYFSREPRPQETVQQDVAPPPSYEEIYPDGSDVRLDYSGSVLEPARDESREKPAELATTTTSARSSEEPAETAEATSAEDVDSGDEQMLEAWKQRQKQLSKDKMLFFFWLPIFVFTLVWISMKLIAYINTVDTQAVKDGVVAFGSRIMNIERPRNQIMKLTSECSAGIRTVLGNNEQ